MFKKQNTKMKLFSGIKKIFTQKSFDKAKDETYMYEAIREAQKVAEGETPIGAIIVKGDEIISRAFRNITNDLSAHTEINAYKIALEKTGEKYLSECTLYVTLEPCLMCASTSYWLKIGRIVYGASGKRRAYSNFGKKVLHPDTVVTKGVLKKECDKLLNDFRAKNNINKNV